MGVVGFAVERPGSPEASFECGKHIITRKFKVLTSSVLDGPMTVASAIGLPQLFQIYTFSAEIHPYCRCRSIETTRMAPASLDWVVTVRYETPEMKDGATQDGEKDGSGSDGGGTGVENDQQFENPLAALPEIDTHWETRQIPIYGLRGAGFQVSVTNGSTTFSIGSGFNCYVTPGDPCEVDMYGTQTLGSYSGVAQTTVTTLSATVVSIDATGLVTLSAPWTGPTGKAVFIDLALKPLQSSAGEIFVPPPMMDDARLILTFTRNENINTPVLGLSAVMMNAVNSDTFFGLNPGQVKCQSITVQRQTKQLPSGNIFPYLRVTYAFHVAPSWDMQLLDKGSYYRYRSSSMNPWSVLRFMTLDNQLRDGLLDGAGQKLADGAAPVFITVRPYNRLPFSVFNLPQSFPQVQ